MLVVSAADVRIVKRGTPLNNAQHSRTVIVGTAKLDRAAHDMTAQTEPGGISGPRKGGRIYDV